MRFFHTILTQFFDTKIFSSETLKYWIGVLWGSVLPHGENVCLALFGHYSRNGITIKIPYGIDGQPCMPYLSIGWVKTKPDLIV